MMVKMQLNSRDRQTDRYSQAQLLRRKRNGELTDRRKPSDTSCVTETECECDCEV